jgi:Na+-translocating ferredoxin:NAD+ oxidoreductase RnfA subunit
VRRAWRGGVHHVVSGASIPYGYTLTVSGTVGVLIHAHGTPDTLDAVLYVLGAALGFALAALADVRDGDGPLGADPRWVGATSAVAAAAGIGLASPVAHISAKTLAFALTGLVATLVYIVLAAAGAAVVERAGA